MLKKKSLWLSCTVYRRRMSHDLPLNIYRKTWKISPSFPPLRLLSPWIGSWSQYSCQHFSLRPLCRVPRFGFARQWACYGIEWNPVRATTLVPLLNRSNTLHWNWFKITKTIDSMLGEKASSTIAVEDVENILRFDYQKDLGIPI